MLRITRQHISQHQQHRQIQINSQKMSSDISRENQTKTVWCSQACSRWIMALSDTEWFYGLGYMMMMMALWIYYCAVNVRWVDAVLIDVGCSYISVNVKIEESDPSNCTYCDFVGFLYCTVLYVSLRKIWQGTLSDKCTFNMKMHQ